MVRAVQLLSAVAIASTLGGCVLAPRGTEQEQARLKAAGKPFTRPFEQRTLPELPHAPQWRDVLRRAFLANGDLEAAYFEWAARTEQSVHPLDPSTRRRLNSRTTSSTEAPSSRSMRRAIST